MHPILFQVGQFTYTSYGFMITLGILASWGVAVWVGKKYGVRTTEYPTVLLWLLVGGLVGGKLLHVALDGRAFLRDPAGMLFDREGFVFLGSFAGALIAVAAALRRVRLPIADTFDVFAVALPLGHALARVGCFGVGCCFGRVVSAQNPLAVRFPHVLDAHGNTVFSFSYVQHVHAGILDAASTASLPVLPTQLFESAGNLLLFGALLWLWRRRAFSGQIALAYLLGYGVLRFALEFLRGDAERGLWLGGTLSTSQLICLGMVFAAVAGFAVHSKRTRSTTPAAAAQR